MSEQVSISKQAAFFTDPIFSDSFELANQNNLAEVIDVKQ
jgi:hypothetical protein